MTQTNATQAAPEPPKRAKSRQVERAEFRAEVKRGRAIGRHKARQRRQLDLEIRKAPASMLRMAAMSAVSTIAGFFRQRRQT